MTGRKVRIRAADLQSDRDGILAVLHRNMRRTASRERFQWLYHANPVGTARVWVAVDVDTGDIVGTSAAFPKRVRVGGTIVSALNLSDFAVDKPYRSLGPALKLLRSTLEPLRSGEFTYGYEQSVAPMPAVYSRIGVRPVAPNALLVRPVLASPVMKKLWGERLAARLIGAVGDAALSVAGRAVRGRDMAIHPMGGRFTDEFTTFEAETARIAHVRLVRDREHLNWRFLDNPLVNYEVLCARSDGGRLEGYLVFRAAGFTVRAVDLVTRDDDPAIALALLDRMASIGRERGAGILTVGVLDSSPVHHVFRRAGFVKIDRERWAPKLRIPEGPRTVVTVYPPAAPSHLAKAVANPRSWQYSQADLEDEDLLPGEDS